MLHIKKIKPLFTSIVTTGNKFEEDLFNGGVLIAQKGDLKLWQTVVAIGSSVRDIKVGDKVMINIDNFAVRRYSKDSIQNDMDNNPVTSYKLNWVSMDGEDGKPVECLLMNDRDVLYTFIGEEIPDKDIKLILPKEKKLQIN